MIDLSVVRAFPSDPFSTSPIPERAGIYAMYHDTHSLALNKDVPVDTDLNEIDYKKHVAYVGLSETNIRRRIKQHIIDRNSSVVTGISAAVLNPDKVSHVCWWCHEDFSDKNRVKAAEIVAFEVFDPSLRSRAPVAESARVILKERAFREKMVQLFNRQPVGLYYPMTFDNLAYWTQKIERRSR